MNLKLALSVTVGILLAALILTVVMYVLDTPNRRRTAAAEKQAGGGALDPQRPSPLRQDFHSYCALYMGKHGRVAGPLVNPLVTSPS